MTIGGNPQDLRDLAFGLRRAADEVEQVQGRVASAQGVQWRGPTAERFLSQVRGHSARIGRSSQATLQAALALETLATALEVRQAAIRAAMAAVELRVDQARRTLAVAATEAVDAAGDAVDAAGDAERALVDRARRLLDEVGPLPLPGHPEWLRLAAQLGAR